MDANDHALVDLGAMVDEQATAILQVEERIAQRLAGHHRDHDAVDALADIALLDRTVMVEDVVEKAGSGRGRHELGLETDEPTGRHHVFQPHPAQAIRHHVQQIALAFAQLFHDGTLVGFFHLDGHEFIRLAGFAVDLLDDDFRAGHAQFVALAAHVLDQDRKMQFTATRDAELVRVWGILNPQRHVVQQFALEALANLARGDEFAFLARER